MTVSFSFLFLSMSASVSNIPDTCYFARLPSELLCRIGGYLSDADHLILGFAYSECQTHSSRVRRLVYWLEFMNYMDIVLMLDCHHTTVNLVHFSPIRPLAFVRQENDPWWYVVKGGALVCYTSQYLLCNSKCPYEERHLRRCVAHLEVPVLPDHEDVFNYIDINDELDYIYY